MSARTPPPGQVTGGPRGPHPYLLKSVSTQRLSRPAATISGRSRFPRQSTADTLHIIALRVEFNGGRPTPHPSRPATGSSASAASPATSRNISATPTILFTNTTVCRTIRCYFANQLRSLASYFAKVSRGMTCAALDHLSATSDPSEPEGLHGAAARDLLLAGRQEGRGELGRLLLPQDQGLMLFVRDALLAAAHDSPTLPLLHTCASNLPIHDPRREQP